MTIGAAGLTRASAILASRSGASALARFSPWRNSDKAADLALPHTSAPDLTEPADNDDAHDGESRNWPRIIAKLDLRPAASRRLGRPRTMVPASSSATQTAWLWLTCTMRKSRAGKRQLTS
jgi:hypothetical protein